MSTAFFYRQVSVNHALPNRSLFEYMLDFYYQTGAVVIESRSWRGEKVCQ